MLVLPYRTLSKLTIIRTGEKNNRKETTEGARSDKNIHIVKAKSIYSRAFKT